MMTGYLGVAATVLLSWALALTAKDRRESSLIENARDISLMLLNHAQDHNGRYPEGATSTEVFQKLVDGDYVSDSDGYKAQLSIFYARMPGKTPATSRQLKPENVSWDVTVPLTVNSPNLPAVFLTGYRLVYKSGGAAIPRPWPPRSWGDWASDTDYPRGFIVVGYSTQGAYVWKNKSDGPIPKVVPDDFIERDNPYRQLTPDGQLP